MKKVLAATVLGVVVSMIAFQTGIMYERNNKEVQPPKGQPAVFVRNEFFSHSPRDSEAIVHIGRKGNINSTYTNIHGMVFRSDLALSTGSDANDGLQKINVCSDADGRFQVKTFVDGEQIQDLMTAWPCAGVYFAPGYQSVVVTKKENTAEVRFTTAAQQPS